MNIQSTAVRTGKESGGLDNAEFEAIRALYRFDRSVQLDRYYRDGEGIPLKSIGISITENCQLKCRWCHIAEIGFLKNYMDKEDFRALLSSCGPLDDIHLTPRGEAFLHPDFMDILKICRQVQPQAKTRVITNGIYSLSGGRADLPAYLDYVAFSVDGATKETYELIRKPAKFENFLESVRRFVAHKEAHQTGAVYKFIFTAGKLNLPELPQLVELAAELKHIESIFVAPMRIRLGAMQRFADELLDAMDDSERVAHLDRAKARARELGIGLTIAKNCYPDRFAQTRDVVEEDVDEEDSQVVEFDNTPFLEFCNQPWNGGMRVGKRLFPCCYMPAGLPPELSQELAERYGFGEEISSYADAHLADFYNSEAFWCFRHDMMTGEAAKFCRNCTIGKGDYKTYAQRVAPRLDPAALQTKLENQKSALERQGATIKRQKRTIKRLQIRENRSAFGKYRKIAEEALRRLGLYSR